MGKSRILILSIALSAFLLGLFLGVFQNFDSQSPTQTANVHASTSTIYAHLDWVEEIEFGDEEKWLEIQGQYYTRIEEFLPHIQSTQLAYVKYVLCKTTSNKIKANGPHIYLLDQVFLI